MARTRVAIAVGAIGALIAVAVGNGAERHSRILDRTLVCPVRGAGYPDPARFIAVGADPFLPANGASPNVYLDNGPIDAGHAHVRMRTGRGNHPSFTRGELSLTRPLCKPTKLRVSLASSGRAARATEPFGELWRCEVPSKLLIRVRAVFRRPTRLIRDPRDSWLSHAKGNIASGSLAVTTLRGKPLFFASVNDATGKARIFVPRGCSRTR
jgi:hypothetical protein